MQQTLISCGWQLGARVSRGYIERKFHQIVTTLNVITIIILEFRGTWLQLILPHAAGVVKGALSMFMSLRTFHWDLEAASKSMQAGRLAACESALLTLFEYFEEEEQIIRNGFSESPRHCRHLSDLHGLKLGLRASNISSFPSTEQHFAGVAAAASVVLATASCSGQRLYGPTSTAQTQARRA